MDHARVDGASCSTRASKSCQQNDGAPSQRAKACRGRGTYTITVTPEHKGLLKDTVDFSQYKSDSPSRPARGGRTHLMIYHEKKRAQLHYNMIFFNWAWMAIFETMRNIEKC